jgi:hypothetical protein
MLGLLWLFGSGQVAPAYASVSEEQDVCLQHESDWDATERNVWASVCRTGSYILPVPCGERSYRGAFTPASKSQAWATTPGLFLLDLRVTSPQAFAHQTAASDAYLQCLRQYQDTPDEAEYMQRPDFEGATVTNGLISIFSGRLAKAVFRESCVNLKEVIITGPFLSTLLTKTPYRERILANGHLDLEGIKIADFFDVSGAVIPDISFSCFDINAADFSDATIEGSIELDNGEFGLTSTFARTHVKNNFQISDVKMHEFSGEGLTVDRALSFSSQHLFALKLTGSTLGIVLLDSIDFVYIFAGRMRVNGPIFIKRSDVGRLYLAQLHVLGDLMITRSHFRDPVSLHLANLESSLLIDDKSTFSDVDLSDSRIGGELAFGTGDNTYHDNDMPKVRKNLPWDCSETQWTGPSSRLDLSGAHIDEIHVPVSMKVWPKDLILSGFSFQDFHVDDKLGPIQNASTMQYFNCWLGRTATQRFDPWPYREVADFLQKTGDDGASRAVGIGGKNRERAQACKSTLSLSGFEYGPTCIYLWLSFLIIGYGYRLYLSVIWSAVFIISGAIIFRHMKDSRDSEIPIGLAYSFDMFLPLVKLRDKHYDLDVKSRARYYLYVHKLAGWVLGSFIVAALSGLTK